MPRVVQALVAGALLIHGASAAVPPADAEGLPAMQDDGDAAEASSAAEAEQELARESEFLREGEGDQMMDDSAAMEEVPPGMMPPPPMGMPPPPMDMPPPMPPMGPMAMDDLSIVPPMDDPKMKVEEKLRKLEEMMAVMENTVFPNCKDKPTQQACGLSAGKCMWKLKELKPANATDGKDGKGKGKLGKDAKESSSLVELDENDVSSPNKDKTNVGDKNVEDKKKKEGDKNKEDMPPIGKMASSMYSGAKKMMGGAMGAATGAMGAMGGAAMKGLRRLGGGMFGPTGPMAQGPPPVLIGECVDVPKFVEGKGKDGKGKGKDGKDVAENMEKMLKKDLKKPKKPKARSI